MPRWTLTTQSKQRRTVKVSTTSTPTTCTAEQCMHRRMPYELVGVPERQEVMEKINRDPNGWVQSLKTFGKYGFFIECDIEAPVELHDKFNDLPFIPRTEGGYVL